MTARRGTARKLVEQHLADAIAAQPHTPAHRWRSQAACADSDPALFVPAVKGPPRLAAVTICSTCPVRIDCATAHAGEELGVWGGLGRSGRDALSDVIELLTGDRPTLLADRD